MVQKSILKSCGFDELSQIADEIKGKYEGCKMGAITNGKKGGIIFNDLYNVDIQSLPGIKQIDSTGAGDAFFGGLIAGIYHYGMPGTKEELARVGNIAKATGAACVEVLGALPIVKDSKQRLLELNGDLQVIMDVNPMPDGDVSVSNSETEGVKLSSVMTSILMDCEALTKMFNKQGLDEQVTNLVEKIANTGKIFVTGVGKSGIMAQRMAASLSSIGYGAEFVNGSDWIHGDIGKLRLKDTGSDNLIIAFSASGKTRELYEAMKWIYDERVAVDENAGYENYKYNTEIIGIFCVDEGDVKMCRESNAWMGDISDEIVYLGGDFREFNGMCTEQKCYYSGSICECCDEFIK